jgi:hypothetical protein
VLRILNEMRTVDRVAWLANIDARGSKRHTLLIKPFNKAGVEGETAYLDEVSLEKRLIP